MAPMIALSLFALRLSLSHGSDVLATANVIPLDQYPRATCLDGSPARYYVRPGQGAGANKFYLHQQGGGFCTNLEDCVSRSRTNLGSTSPNVPDAWGPTINLTALTRWGPAPIYFSTAAKINPLLADWNHVFMVYCDGAYFSGSNDSRVVVNGTTLHFSGKHILDATLSDIASRHNLGTATDVMVGGCSAGAIATFAHLDYIAAKLAPGGGLGLAPRARVTGFADSGFYADVPFFTTKKAFAFQAQNASATLSQECLLQHHSAPHKCLVAEVNAPYIRTPLFAWQSKFDADQLGTSISPACKTAACADPYAAHLVRAMKDTLFRAAPAHGAFVDGCWKHCAWAPGGGDLERISAEGVTPLWALLHWYDGTRPDRQDGVTHEQCVMSDNAKQDCGSEGVDEKGCSAKNCCFGDKREREPLCYHRLMSTRWLTLQNATSFPCKLCCPRSSVRTLV